VGGTIGWVVAGGGGHTVKALRANGATVGWSSGKWPPFCERRPFRTAAESSRSGSVFGTVDSHLNRCRLDVVMPRGSSHRHARA
jgi:hypothetical protein